MQTQNSCNVQFLGREARALADRGREGIAAGIQILWKNMASSSVYGPLSVAAHKCRFMCRFLSALRCKVAAQEQ